MRFVGYREEEDMFKKKKQETEIDMDTFAEEMAGSDKDADLGYFDEQGEYVSLKEKLREEQAGRDEKD